MYSCLSVFHPTIFSVRQTVHVFGLRAQPLFFHLTTHLAVDLSSQPLLFIFAYTFSSCYQLVTFCWSLLLAQWLPSSVTGLTSQCQGLAL